MIGAPSLCSLGSGPVGAETAAPTDLAKPVAAYKTYVIGEVDTLVKQTRKFVAEVKEGDLDEARKFYAPAHEHHERIEPIAELFNDLDGSMDSREDDFEKAEDPRFLGFHRVSRKRSTRARP